MNKYRAFAIVLLIVVIVFLHITRHTKMTVDGLEMEELYTTPSIVDSHTLEVYRFHIDPENYSKITDGFQLLDGEYYKDISHFLSTIAEEKDMDNRDDIVDEIENIQNHYDAKYFYLMSEEEDLKELYVYSKEIDSGIYMKLAIK